MPKYDSYDNIPAKVFFDILETQDYQLLKPKPKENKKDDLKALFMHIYDRFYLESNDKEAKRYLDLTKSIAVLEYKIDLVRKVLHLLHYYPKTRKLQSDLVKALKVGCGIEIDEKNQFADEVLRVLNVDLGILQTDLDFYKAEFAEMIRVSKSKDYTYFDSLVDLSEALPNNALLKESMLLATYVALKKKAKQISELNKSKKWQNL